MARTILVVGTFNTHAAMDGYARRYDLVEACRAIQADVLVLEEVFAPRDGGPSQADDVARALGFQVVELPIARAWRHIGPMSAPRAEAWEPKRPYQRSHRALRIGTHVRSASARADGYEEGMWGIAVLARDRIVSSEVIELGRLRRDVSHRAALEVRLANGLTVVGTHMSHVTSGSPLQLRRLHRSLPDRARPAVLAGDMNLWGPPVRLMLPGWRRTARGKTWPAQARHTHSQLDHIFINGSVEFVGGGVVATGNSDHWPLRAEISFDREAPDP